jgi:hypothetical protein
MLEVSLSGLPGLVNVCSHMGSCFRRSSCWRGYGPSIPDGFGSATAAGAEKITTLVPSNGPPRATPSALDSARMTASRRERKSEAAAGLLGLGLAGAGHVYAGETERGLVIDAAYWLGIVVAQGGGRTDKAGRGAGFVALGAFGVSVIDGILAGRRYNARFAISSTRVDNSTRSHLGGPIVGCTQPQRPLLAAGSGIP